MSYASAATNIVGGEMQGWAALLEQKAMLEALQQQLAAQRGFADVAGTQFNQQYLPQLGEAPAQQKLGQAASSRDAAYTQADQRPLTGGAGPSASVQGALALQGKQRAGLGAYGDYSLGQGIGTGKFNDVIRRIGARAQGSAAVYPYQLDAAQHSWDTLAAIGQAISSIGGSGANYSQLFGQRPQSAVLGQQVNTAYPGGQGYGGAGVDGSSTMGSEQFTNIA